MAKFFWNLLHIRKANQPERLCLIQDALAAQEMFLQRKMTDEPPNDKYQFLMFAEHDNVYVATQRDQEKMNELGGNARLFRADMGRPPAHFYILPENRGGSITFHGPGQIVCYMILCMEDLGIDGPLHLASIIDEIIKEFLEYFGIKGYTTEELCNISDPDIEGQLLSHGLLSGDEGNRKMTMSARGVWVINDVNEAKKIASRGIKAVRHNCPDGTAKHFTKYGFLINISTDLTFFDYIYPCGEDIEMTSIKALTGETHEIYKVVPKLADIVIKNLDKKRRSKKRKQRNSKK